MDRSQSAKVRRGLVIERMALDRCRSEEARKALESYFKANLEIWQAAGVKANVTRKQGEHENVDYEKSLQARLRVEGN